MERIREFLKRKFPAAMALPTVNRRKQQRRKVEQRRIAQLGRAENGVVSLSAKQFLGVSHSHPEMLSSQNPKIMPGKRGVPLETGKIDIKDRRGTNLGVHDVSWFEKTPERRQSDRRKLKKPKKNIK